MKAGYWRSSETLRRVQTALARCPVSPLPLQTWMFLSGLHAPRLSVATKSPPPSNTHTQGRADFCAVHDVFFLICS